MYNPTTRALTLLELLQTHGRISGAELARRLEVDTRTVRRYIARLEDIGIPITAERGRYGAYLLVAGYKLPPMMFSNDEALALTVGLIAARSFGLAAGAAAIESAQSKLERVLPASLRVQPRALSQTLALDLAEPGPVADGAVLAMLSRAAQARQRVHLHYRNAQGEDSERDFDAWGLVWRAGRWYVLGMCRWRQAQRSFRLDRIRALQPVAAYFARPDDFDAAAALSLGIATVTREFPVEVQLYTDIAGALTELPSGLGIFQVNEDGVLLRTQTDSIDWFARQLARLPYRFDIRQPARLREALYAHATRLLALAEVPDAPV